VTAIDLNRKPQGFDVWQDKKPPFAWRCRHRKSGKMIDLVKFPIYTLPFYAECERHVAATKAEETKPGTLGHLIARFRAETNLSWTDLAPRTRSDYQKCFDYLYPIRDTALDRFTPPLVVKIRDKAALAHGRRFGTYVKQVLSLLFEWGKEKGFIKTNPAQGIKGVRKKRGGTEANRPWADAERHVVMPALPAHMAVPIGLMMYCGLDPQDALRLPKTAIVDGRINTARGKTAVPVWFPLPAPVIELLAAAPKHDAITLCANSYGKPWTVSGFRASWRPIRKKLEDAGKVQPGLTLKGLRHTVATILREMGKDYGTIAGMLGQKTEAMAKHYSRRADMSRQNEATVMDFNAEVNRRRTKTVKPA
jgi:integrase